MSWSAIKDTRVLAFGGTSARLFCHLTTLAHSRGRVTCRVVTCRSLLSMFVQIMAIDLNLRTTTIGSVRVGFC